MMSDTESELEGFDPERYNGENISVSGQPRTGGVVTVEYDSRAGGAFSSDSLTEVRGELLYVTHTFGDEDRLTFVIRDSERGRAVAFRLEQDPTDRGTEVRSLAARKSKYGQRLGELRSVTFTDESVDHLAPATNALRDARAGDTISVGGTEYGVVSAESYGPSKRPARFSAVLTRPDGSEYVLKTHTETNQVKFSERFSDYADELEMDPSSVQSERFRERLFSHENEGLDTEDTTDAFPAPHGAREGERITFTLTGEDRDDERVSGEVADVRYFRQREFRSLGDPEERPPETTVELDDGREVRLKNTGRRSRQSVTRSRRKLMGEDGKVNAWVITRREGEDTEHERVEAVDIQPEGANVETDGGERGVMTDGGDSLDALARDVSEAFANSDVALERVNVSVDEVNGDVTVQANGAMGREGWNELRDTITDTLDAAGFPYRAKEQWAFVEVTGGREVETDGGVALAADGGSGPSPGEDPHTEVKLKVSRTEPVIMASTVGDDGQYLAIWRDSDADSEELERYHLVMELAEYIDVDPYSTLDDDPGGVTGEGVALDLWKQKQAMTDGGVVQPNRGDESPTALALDAVYTVVQAFGQSVTLVPSSDGCTVKYDGSIGHPLATELDKHGLETRHRFSSNGPELGDRTGIIRVDGFRDGGDGDE